MAKRLDTPQMAELYERGFTYGQIGDVFGVSSTAVGVRLRRLGISRVSIRSKALLIAQNRLAALYEIERLTLTEIADAFGVTIEVVNYALKLYGIAKRSPVRRGIKYFDRLRNLALGETIEIECQAKNARLVLNSSVCRLGIKLSVWKIGLHLYRVTRVDLANSRQDSDISRIDTKILKELYYDLDLGLVKTATRMNRSVNTINAALKFHKLPKRRQHWGHGKYTSIFKKMKVGETNEVECTAKNPYHNLHSIAVRIGMKISMHKIAETKYRVTRLR